MTRPQKMGRPPNTDRDNQIVERRAAGVSTAQLAREHGLSRVRVRAILSERQTYLTDIRAGGQRTAAVAADIERQSAVSAGYAAGFAEGGYLSGWLAGWAAADRKAAINAELGKLPYGSPEWRRKHRGLTEERAGINAEFRQKSAESSP